MTNNNPVVVNEKLMTQLQGGHGDSARKFCGISAECTGNSCNTVSGVFDQLTVWAVYWLTGHGG